jgi:hypothetical protein
MSGLSIRAFAKIVKVSEGTIRNMIKSGALKDCLIVDPVTKARSINLQVGKIEFADNLPDSKTAVANLTENLKKVGKPNSQTKADFTVVPPQDPDEERKRNDPSFVSKSEADRLSSVYNAQIKGLELDEKQGLLIDKNKIYRVLNIVGQDIRKAIMAVPSKHIDNILAAENRNEAEIMLTNALADVLTKLSGLNDKKLFTRA